MHRLNINEMMRGFYNAEKKNGLCTSLLGIGPMSEPLIEATLQLAQEKDFPVLFIASRNQIDADEFGRGYVRDWDQVDFVSAVRKIEERIGFTGLCYICRDHGGPWQRDKERAEKLPENEAMEIAKRSYLADLKAGFDLLHIDPTKDPHAGPIVPMDVVLDRTVELIEYVETERKKLNIPEIAYEVGTEETNGGLTSETAYEDFIKKLTDTLRSKGLPMPLFIVGQTGTLTRLTENVGNFNEQFAKKLSEIARKYDVALKEHNGDYLSDAMLTIHPGLGITGINVAPEYGVAETAAYFTLADAEERFAKLGLIEKASSLISTLSEETVRTERWRKWMVGKEAEMSIEDVLANSSLTEQIAKVGGHYSFEIPTVKKEIDIMFINLSSVGIDAHTFVRSAIKRCIVRYVDCLGMEGLTGKIKEALL